MDLEGRDDNEKVIVNANKIIMKYRNKNDRLLFCYERNWWHPQEIGFDSTYFLQVLAGCKKYLPGNFEIKYKIGSFKNGLKLDKKFIISKMRGNATYGDYVPDECVPMKLSRNFLLTLVAFIDPGLYHQFYESYKNELNKRKYNKWSEYSLEVKKDIVKDINDFMPVNYNKKNTGGFRLNKNHRATNIFSKNNVLPQQNNNIQNIGQIDRNGIQGAIYNRIIPQEDVPKQNLNEKNINIKIVKK